MSKQRECIVALLLALVSAVSVLLIATTSSPLYATNFWTDTNIYFTIGRGMKHGFMPYTDLFDHKGPLLYMIYAVAAVISENSFVGVFLLEVLSLAAFLYLAYMTVGLFGEGMLNLISIPCTAVLTVTCTAFNQGGCAEEFILPALMLALYTVLKRFEQGSNCLKQAYLYMAFGASVGWVFAIKYTNCGLFFGLAFSLFLYEWRLNGFVRAVVCGLYALGGFAAIVLPVAVYLALNGALDACMHVYFYENIFLYAGESMGITGHIYNALAYLRTQSIANPAIACMAMLGCIQLFFRTGILHRKGFVFEAMAVPFAAGLLLLFTYWGEMAHPYYALVFASLAPLGFCPILGKLSETLKDWKWGLSALILLVIGVPVCLSECAAVPLMKVKREDMAQTKAAEIICAEAGATLLDWSSLDQGFYLATGILPTQRYFANNNLDTAEKREAYRACVDDGKVDYVVTNQYQPAPSERYEMVAELEGVFDLSSARTYRVYRLKGR